MSHFWDCLIYAPGGCSDLIWAQDYYDWFAGIVSFGGAGFVLGWMFVDWIKQ